MSNILVRNPRMDEVPLLKNLWSSVFGNIGIDAFFRLFFKPELCVVVEQNGSLAAMGYLIPSGDIKTVPDDMNNTNSLKCAMIYSVGTLPEYRSMGLGTIIVNDLIALAGDLNYDMAVLCPSEEGLFEYYSKRTKLHDWFYACERKITEPIPDTPSVLPTEISINEYLTFREKFLTEIMHIRQEEQLFKYQIDLCKELGGGLFRIGNSCAVVERQSGSKVWIKELLIPGKGNIFQHGHLDDDDYKIIISSIAHTFPADEYLIRTPAKSGAGRRFGMVNLCGNVHEISLNGEFAPWYGMAFD